MKTTVQKPTALWTSQFTRFHWRVKSMLRLRRQFVPQGHQMTAPVRHIAARHRAPRCGRRIDARDPIDGIGLPHTVHHVNRIGQRAGYAGREEIGIECPLHVDAKDQRRAGRAHNEDVQPGGDTDPQMQLEEKTPGGHRQIMKLFPPPPAIDG